MEYVNIIIEKFGGITKLANAMSLRASVVQGWKDRGYVPARQQHKVILTALSMGIELTPNDFFDDDVITQKKARESTKNIANKQ